MNHSLPARRASEGRGWNPIAAMLVGVLLLSGCTPPPAKPRITVPDPEPVVVQKPKPDPNAVLPITYEDLDLPMEPNTLFQDYMLTQRVRDLDGKRVRIRGFMFAGSVFTTSKVKRFFLLREVDCPFGPDGQAHHAIEVELEGVTSRFTVAPLTIEGTLTVRPFTGENGKTWAVYHLAGTKVE